MAEKAKDLYRRIGLPGYCRYIKALVNAAIMNCPVNIDDVRRALDVWGRDIIGLKGRDVRRRPESIGWIGNIPLPEEIWERHKSTMISIDYVFVHGLPQS